MSGANPDLPILDEIGAEFAALVDAEFAAAGRGAERARLQRSPRRPQHVRGARRMARRSALVLVLLCLVGGVALARFGGGGAPPSDTAPTTLAASSAEGWQLSGYRDRGRLCFAFIVRETIASDCGGEPQVDGVRAISALAAGNRFVVGLAGPLVDSVSVRLDGGATATGSTEALADPELASEAGVPAEAGWFVVPIEETPATARLRGPATITPRDAAGNALRQPLLDCSLGVVDLACERAIRSEAERRAR